MSCTSKQHNIIMYDNLQQAINPKKITFIPRQYPSSRFHDMSSVEPWQKYTIQMVKTDQTSRQVKTFYDSPKKNQHQKYYQTSRGLSFRTERVHQPVRKTQSLLSTARKCALSQYNINGNILGQKVHSSSLPPFQALQKSFKIIRQTQKASKSKGMEFQNSKLKGYQSLMQICRKLTLQKDKLNEDYVHFNSEFDDQGCRQGHRARRNKILSLGFQKLYKTKPRRENINRNRLDKAF